MELLRLVGVDGQADKLPTAVSSGQQQEAAIARALATDPPIVVADEPTGNLDSRSAENVLDLFERLARSGKTILIVTHDPSIAQRTDHMIILSDGELVDRSVPRALPFLSHPSLQEAVSRARRRHVPAGAMILQPGRSPQDLYMVVGGEVEVFARKPDARETRIARLASGKFFGAVELGRGADSRAGVRALSGGAELAVLPRGIVDELMNVPTAGPVEVHGHDGRQVGAT
jgi:ABC-type glutathione transport system ATPase component